MNHDFYSSYAFTSLTATFIILYGDVKSTHIGCVSAVVTPDLGGLAWMLKFLPLLVVALVGAATIFAAIYSPWGDADIFHWSSNYGRDSDLLRLVTPGFGDCLQYIQFVVLTGGLTLKYPGFYQPIVSQGSWAALMFNQSFVTKDPGWVNVRDGIYVTDGEYGLHKLAQLAGIRNVEDIWAGMMVWLMASIGGMIVLVQGGFFLRWLYRSIKKIPEEDLRSKNFPFTVGNVIRIVFNYFLLPIVSLSTFQLVVAGVSPTYTVALAVLTLVLIIGFAAWLLRVIITTKPRSFLFDDLETVLMYGPLYNTYSDDAAPFALIPVLLTFVRGIAIGAVQPAGVAQVVLLAICEVIQILTLHAFRPFHSPTSMNAYHTLFSALRLITVLLMVAFIPSIGVTDGPKGWIGYAILVTHAGVLILGFLLNAVQTIVEVVARMLGAGEDDVGGHSRGALSKILGMRQLRRRMSRRQQAISRHSQLSNAAMLDADEVSKTGYVMPSGRVRSESAGSIGALAHRRHRSSSALESLSLDTPVRPLDSGAYTPTTLGEASTFSYLPSPKTVAHRQQAPYVVPNPDPYYRPPRQRRQTLETPTSTLSKPGTPSRAGDWPKERPGQSGTSTAGEPAELSGDPVPDTGYATYSLFGPRTDYSTREVDFYYGVRGERLNSDAPNRKLRTGPADPTKPISTASSWLWGIFGKRKKDKGKGFEVVRSTRMPPAMRANLGESEDERGPQGIPVAMGVLRNGPIESDDEDNNRQKNDTRQRVASPEQERLSLRRTSGESSPDESSTPYTPLATTVSGAITPDMSSQQAKPEASQIGVAVSDDLPVPEVPRKSSRRNSWRAAESQARSQQQQQQQYHHDRQQPSSSSMSEPPHANLASHSASATTTTARLPFQRTPSQKTAVSGSSTAPTDEFVPIDLVQSNPPAGYGFVNQGSVRRVDREVDLLGASSAEVVDPKR
jgi:hypothetical protein